MKFNIKNTKLWAYLRNKRAVLNNKRRYIRAKRMSPNEYEEYVSEIYNQKMSQMPFTNGEKMDFRNPVTFTQKQQWLNLYDQDPRKTTYTDKYEVRKHIEKVIGKNYLVPLLKIDGRDVFDSPNEINFSKLPNSFVIKCTHGSHMNIIVKDKSALLEKDIVAMKNQLRKWMKIDYTFSVCLELQYHNIKPRIIIEEYIATDGDLPDYKFFCFAGELKFMWVDTSRFTGHRRTVYDLDFKKAPFQFDLIPEVEGVEKPLHFDEMKALSLKLCEDFAFVRVDFYESNGKLYFGELTFSSHAGLMPPRPIEYNKILGEYIKIDKNIRDKDFKYRQKDSHR